VGSKSEMDAEEKNQKLYFFRECSPDFSVGQGIA
jgi:hypothetical protein